MALGEWRLFQFKSKKQREKEEKAYAKWAFPYGDLQRERLTELIKKLMPKGPVEINLASFLTCKELYEDTLENSQSREEATDKMINVKKLQSAYLKRGYARFAGSSFGGCGN